MDIYRIFIANIARDLGARTLIVDGQRPAQEIAAAARQFEASLLKSENRMGPRKEVHPFRSTAGRPSFSVATLSGYRRPSNSPLGAGRRRTGERKLAIFFLDKSRRGWRN
jgi:hypothetical protein